MVAETAHPTQHTAALSIPSIMFASWQDASRSWSWGAFWTPHFGEGGSYRESAMVPFERTMVVSYWLSIANIALSLTIRPHLPSNTLK